MRYIIRYTVICTGNVLMCNDSKIKVELPAMLRTSPVVPRTNGLEKTGNHEMDSLYQTKK